jgi:hypothetical protein
LNLLRRAVMLPRWWKLWKNLPSSRKVSEMVHFTHAFQYPPTSSLISTQIMAGILEFTNVFLFLSAAIRIELWHFNYRLHPSVSCLITRC